MTAVIRPRRDRTTEEEKDIHYGVINIDKLQDVIEDVEKFFDDEELRIKATKMTIEEVMDDPGVFTLFQTYLTQVHEDIYGTTRLV